MAKKKAKDKLVSATYMIPETVKDAVQEQADEEGLSAADIARRALKSFFKKNRDSEEDTDRL